MSGWLKSSHRAVAVCNDCHTPPGFVGKYTTKARNGFWHSYYFTTGWFEDNIHITPRGREVTEEACRKCHQEIVDAIEGTRRSCRVSNKLHSVSRLRGPHALTERSLGFGNRLAKRGQHD